MTNEIETTKATTSNVTDLTVYRLRHKWVVNDIDGRYVTGKFLRYYTQDELLSRLWLSPVTGLSIKVYDTTYQVTWQSEDINLSGWLYRVAKAREALETFPPTRQPMFWVSFREGELADGTPFAYAIVQKADKDTGEGK